MIQNSNIGIITGLFLQRVRNGTGFNFLIVLLIMKEIIVTPEFDIDSVPIIRAVADLVCDK